MFKSVKAFDDTVHNILRSVVDESFDLSNVNEEEFWDYNEAIAYCTQEGLLVGFELHQRDITGNIHPIMIHTPRITRNGLIFIESYTTEH